MLMFSPELLIIVIAVIITALIMSAKRKQKPKLNSPYTADQAKAEIEQRQAAIEAERQKEREERAAAKAEWDSKHGRIITSIAGVTFNNEDGTSRQKILRDVKSYLSDAELTLQEYQFNGKPAIHVYLDDQCIGDIPKAHVKEVLDIMDKVEHVNLDINVFYPEDDEWDDDAPKRKGEKIYRADLTIVYSK